MNTKRIILAACCLLLTTLAARADDVFRMKKAAGAHVETLKVERRFGKSEAFSPFLSKGAITALSITGSFEKTGDEYLVRVLLKDADGKEHLVMESYEEICDKEQFAFAGYCEETALLEGIRPDSIKVYVRDAVLRIESIDIQTVAPGRMLKGGAFKAAKAEARRAQVEAVAKKINEYNVSHGKIWIAEVTDIALADYGVRRAVTGCPDGCQSGGIEYYVDGFFEVGKANPETRKKTLRSSSSSVVSEFDWRTRHGRNWITPVKSQYGNTCVAFAGVSCLESLMNLYYNQIFYSPFNDLSEWELAYYGNENNMPLATGVSPSRALSHLVNYGIGNEEVNPFPNQDVAPYTPHTPNFNVKIESYSIISHDESYIKHALIEKGPLASGFIFDDYVDSIDYSQDLYVGGHAMSLIGFGVVQKGDTIGVNSIGTLVVEEGNNIGKTFWLFKNSWGNNSYDALCKIVFNDYSRMAQVYSLNIPITVTPSSYSPSVICEDRDGDGYYFWGIGQKPANCPDWVPDVKDGDDFNINYGTMDENGFLQSLSPNGYTINTSVTYSSNNVVSSRIGIVNNGILTITGTTTMNAQSVIRVCEGGTLIVDGGTLQNANLKLIPGSHLIIRNNGSINMSSDTPFYAPLGVIVDIESGTID